MNLLGEDAARGSAPDVIPVRTGEGGGRTYPVLVARGLLRTMPAILDEHAPAHLYAVVSDSNVAPLYGTAVVEDLRRAGRRAELFTFPAGETSKSREAWAGLTDAMLGARVGRDGAVVAVGGGVTGDLGGFVAATYMRGVPLVHVPTSLVAMIDSSVGGKTGIDVDAGKNLVGAFHPPRAVVVDVELASTLPRRERSQGLAEAVKHGAILDAAHFNSLAAEAEALLDGSLDETGRAVRESVALKAEVVGRDEREGGLRKILNFGHTLGHAIEAASAYGVPHGSAVAIGMVLEARLGEGLGVTAPGVADALAEALARLDLPVSLPAALEAERVLAGISVDKKARSGRPRYVLLRTIGEVDRGDGWVHEVPGEAVREVLEGGRRG